MEKEINYTFWGESIDSNWYEWYQTVEAMFEKHGCKITHLGINSESYNPNGVVTALRKEKALMEILKNGEVPNAIECYSVPKNYTTVGGDFDICCIRKNNFISVIIREKNILNIDEKSIWDMKKYLKFDSGEVFSAEKLNSLFYTYTRDKGKVNHLNYEFIKNIDG